MSVAAQIAAGLGLVGGLFALLFALRLVARRFGWPPELARKTIHVATGLGALALPWVVTLNGLFYGLIGVALAVLALLRLPRFRGSAAALHGVERASHGELFLVASIGLLHLFAGDRTILYVLPLAIVTLGDAAAALTGSAYGRRLFRVEDGMKSLEGSAILFLVSTILAMACLLLLTDIPRENVILLGLMTALFATLVEADSWRGFDNLFLPMGLLIFLSTALDAGAAELSGRMALFLGSLAGLAWAAPRLGLKAHAMRVHVIAVFLILSATTAPNALLPIAALLAHMLAQARRPGADRHPDLDMIAALAMLSFAALAAGRGLGVNVIDFYGLAAAGLTAALAGLAVARVATALAIAAGLIAVWAGVMALNAPFAGWHGDLRPAGVVLIGGAALSTTLRPQAFHRARVPRLMAATALPAACLLLFHLVTGGPR